MSFLWTLGLADGTFVKDLFSLEWFLILVTGKVGFFRVLLYDYSIKRFFSALAYSFYRFCFYSSFRTFYFSTLIRIFSYLCYL